jgi:hypothetical protein
MLDLRVKAQKAAEEILNPGEEILAAAYVTESPIKPVGFLTGTGLMTGGIVGAAVGAAVERAGDRREAERNGADPMPEVAHRGAMGPELPKVTGGLLAVTPQRVLVWALSATNKPKTLLHDLPVSSIDSASWQRVAGYGKALLGSIVLWIGVGREVMVVAMVAVGPTGHNAVEVLDALTGRCPGRVAEFTSPDTGPPAGS